VSRPRAGHLVSLWEVEKLGQGEKNPCTIGSENVCDGRTEVHCAGDPVHAVKKGGGPTICGLPTFNATVDRGGENKGKAPRV